VLSLSETTKFIFERNVQHDHFSFSAVLSDTFLPIESGKTMFAFADLCPLTVFQFFGLQKHCIAKKQSNTKRLFG